MKQPFEAPEITVQEFSLEDILTAFGDDNGTCNHVDFIPV